MIMIMIVVSFKVLILEELQGWNISIRTAHKTSQNLNLLFFVWSWISSPGTSNGIAALLLFEVPASPFEVPLRCHSRSLGTKFRTEMFKFKNLWTPPIKMSNTTPRPYPYEYENWARDKSCVTLRRRNHSSHFSMGDGLSIIETSLIVNIDIDPETDEQNAVRVTFAARWDPGALNEFFTIFRFNHWSCVVITWCPGC